MIEYKQSYKPFGNSAILIEWPQKIDSNILKEVLSFKNILLKHYVKVNIEIIHTYNSITIIYHSAIENIYNEILTLKSLRFTKDTDIIHKKKRWEIPVCYHPQFGLDLVEIAKIKNMNLEALITLHTRPIYTIYFIGFLPGFLYLGGLPSDLHLERKNKPRLSVEKGAVGIGGQQTGIYPSKNAGGWHIIGNSPIDFFAIDRTKPCFANAGDELVFKSVDLAVYEQIKADVQNNTYELNYAIL